MSRGRGVVAILKNRKLIFASIFWMSMLGFGWYLGDVTQTVSDQFITSDTNFSVLLSQSIKALLAQNLDLAPQVRFGVLKANFPMVAQLKIQRTQLNKTHVQVVAADLAYRLGNNFVLTRGGDVFLASCFSNAVLATLPEIFLHTAVESPTEIEAAQKTFLLQLPAETVAQYEVHWYGPNQICLINKTNKMQHIMVRYDQILTPAIFTTCQQLLTTYQVHANKNCKGVIKTDLRFDKQIIVSC